MLQFVGDLIDDGAGEPVGAAVALPVGVHLQRFHGQHVAHAAFLTLESADVGLTLGRIAAPGAVALKVLALAQDRPSLFRTCPNSVHIVTSNYSQI